MDELKVIELFAGVGGFRVGLERVNEETGSDFYNVIWANQWEPATKTQHAWRTYERQYGAGSCVNVDIALVPSSKIPQHNMLVGGFPCQDYSVARTLSQSAGLVGKKGVLWWQIHRIVKDKGKTAPEILFLENVDRLVQSPASQRGRDFAIILQSLADLGYVVEWRIINAADYGMPQRRRRIYILAFKKGSKIAKSINDSEKWLFNDGIFAKAFPIKEKVNGSEVYKRTIKLHKTDDLANISEDFNKEKANRVFQNAGVMIDGTYITYKSEPNYQGYHATLADIVLSENDGELRESIIEDFYISDEDIERWQYQKGGKKLPRTNKQTGITYMYSEGSMAFPDPLDKPSRTIITSEGNKSPNRFSHVIKDPVNGRLRRLVPIELERLDMFPDGHTEGETNEKRAFFMGNALVCGVVTNVARELMSRLK